MSDTEETVTVVDEPVVSAPEETEVSEPAVTEVIEDVVPEETEEPEDAEETEVSEDPVEAPVEESSEPVASVAPVVQVAADIRNILTEVPSSSVETVDDSSGSAIKQLTKKERHDFNIKIKRMKKKERHDFYIKIMA